MPRPLPATGTSRTPGPSPSSAYSRMPRKVKLWSASQPRKCMASAIAAGGALGGKSCQSSTARRIRSSIGRQPATARADLLERLVELRPQRLARRLVGQRLDLEMEEALEPAARRLLVEHPVGRGVEQQRGMQQRLDDSAMRPDGRQHAVDDERHVGREHLDDFRFVRTLGRDHVNVMVQQLALPQPSIGAAQQLLELLDRPAAEILGVHRPGDGGKKAGKTGLARLEGPRPGEQCRTHVELRCLVQGRILLLRIPTLRPGSALVEW